MIRRSIAAIAVIWFMGFLWFTVALPGPMDRGATQAVIVPTGAAGRIERGLEVVEGGDAGLLLVTGVDREVRPSEFAVQFEVPKQLMQCCVFLGFDAVDTRGNATETAEWIAERNIRSIRLVTTDWHMRRAALELSRAIPEDVVIVEDAVVSEPSLRILFLEYHKYLASKVSGLWG
ncbi:YdcF family protein [Altererythrobacter luteolus]|uniref:YdcF family protein n=1 Tax=Pontixanthobacter luteolus TaxID=295089 RepID=A0A6I4V5L8_9SPHN|nr:YdcF family protein [Pontixanthobacter luteolus]MXP48356.1 YdcF family protein [Pontixanthobacter luteolus]